MKEKIIFDLDGTLMNADFSLEDDFFRERLGKNDADKFVPVKYDLLLKYEDLFSRYDIKCLSEFLTIGSGVNITENISRMCGMTAVGAITIAVFSTYQFIKLKRDGIVTREAAIQIGKQALFSLSLLLLVLFLN